MAILNTLWWQRLRHGRGFGIHSPFAFRFITEVLNGPYAYYAYPSIERLSASLTGVSADELKALFRVLVYFQPRHVAVCGDRSRPLHKAVCRIVRSAVPHAVVVGPDRECDFVVALPGRAAEGLGTVSRQKASAYIFSAEQDCPALDEFVRNLGFGMVFTNRRSVSVIAALPHLPAQYFQVRF